MIVTIDGPAGAGKTTVARRLAGVLGYAYLDSGALYRAVTLKALETGIDRDDEAAWAALVRDSRIECRGERVWLDGCDVTEAIRRPEVTAASKAAARSAAVREGLKPLQRAFGRDGCVVAEGRDMGTVIFPGADRKFFLTASAEVRARRRYRELAQIGHETSFEEVLEAQRRRDAQDSQRELSPLRQAPDAVVVDTTDRTIDEVVDHLRRRIEE